MTITMIPKMIPDTDVVVAATTPVPLLDLTIIKKVLSERKIQLRHEL